MELKRWRVYYGNDNNGRFEDFFFFYYALKFAKKCSEPYISVSDNWEKKKTIIVR